MYKFEGLKERFGKRYILIISVIFGILLFLFLYNNVRPKDLDIREGHLASETIRANKSIENKAETEEKKRLAEEAVTPKYNFDESIGHLRVEATIQLYEDINETRRELKERYDAKVAKAKKDEVVKYPTVEEHVALLKSKFEKVSAEALAYYQTIPNVFYESVFQLDDEKLALVRDTSVNIIEETMKEHIRSDNIASIKQNAYDQIRLSELDNSEQQLVRYITDNAIVVNEVLDEKKTEEMKEAARANVSPVMIYYGEVIVREGVQIDSRAYQKLKLLGLTNQTPSMFPVVALVLLIVLQIALLLWLVRTTTHEKQQFRFINFYVFMMLISVLLMKAVAVFLTENLSFVPMIFPAGFVPLILNLFISRRASVLGALFQVAFASFVFYDLGGTSTMVMITMTYLFTGLMATLIQRERIGRQIAPAVIWLILFPVIFVFIMTIYQGMNLGDDYMIASLLSAFIGSLFSYLMSIGLHPYIELLLNDDSVLVLNELSNPNHPLLKQLLEEAPGTYHHSMMVASLSANAVAEIGGRSLLTRVACYYHDIGKIKHVNFFVENLPAGADNPHNFLLPEDSKEIIFSHVSEGVKILKKEKMPQLVIDICQQHHGTTLMSFFYAKAKERNPDVTEADFRYPGPRPQTREAAVVSLADTCEAAIRAMKEPTNEKIAEFVYDLVERRILDGQLDESGLTLAEIRIVEKSLINGLCSTFHSRIEYPKMKKELKESEK